ncbi:PDZ domain-containing protein [Flavobacterium humi]|uniref:Signal protein PDZ n=1 Tax=Flavobacterium humi TaxID=2562683 RepID=A0A4Z0LBW3_9FLAO|nr:PDZ domain-containing protein [Flavobacterium humi]TGD59358.1 signal protein PDZ [Flavobacterium humi]
MKKIYLSAFFVLYFLTAFSQEGFHFISDKKKITIPFQLSNNLAIIPIKVNGVSLNFLLDTGVEKTVLFSLEDTDSLQFNSVEKIKIKGLGDGKSIDALHSKKNKIAIGDLVDDNHEIYIVLDQDINFSSQLGIPVHGILGYHFFKDNFIEINYSKKKIIVYKNSEAFPPKKLKKFEGVPLSLELEKPYIEATVSLNSKEIRTKLLVDTGGSDALWLFENKNTITVPEKYFDDFLGRGFSGDIYGKRSRIDKIRIGEKDIDFPTTSFPDGQSLQSVSMVEGRNGSLGSEILKRFTVLFDYAHNRMYLKKNLNFYDPFNYSMSGIEFQHSGLQWVEEKVELKTEFVKSENTKTVFDDRPTNVKYEFKLKPLYEVSAVRKDSPGDLAGIKKGDIIRKINGRNAFNYKLQEINDLMQSEEGRVIFLEIERNKGEILKIKIQLKKIL